MDQRPFGGAGGDRTRDLLTANMQRLNIRREDGQIPGTSVSPFEAAE